MSNPGVFRCLHDHREFATEAEADDHRKTAGHMVSANRVRPTRPTVDGGEA